MRVYRAVSRSLYLGRAPALARSLALGRSLDRGRCRERARSIGQRFAGSEVETAAEGLVGEVQLALGTLETDLYQDEITRLQAIREVLAASESPRLAAEVGSYLSERYGASE